MVSNIDMLWTRTYWNQLTVLLRLFQTQRVDFCVEVGAYDDDDDDDDDDNDDDDDDDDCEFV